MLALKIRLSIVGLFLLALGQAQARNNHLQPRVQSRTVETLDSLGDKGVKWQRYLGLRLEFEGAPTLSKHKLQGDGFTALWYRLNMRVRVVNETPDRVGVDITRAVIYAPGQKGSHSLYLGRVTKAGVRSGNGVIKPRFLKAGEATPWVTLGTTPYARIVKDLSWSVEPGRKASVAILLNVVWKDIRTLSQGRTARVLLRQLVRLVPR